MYIHVYSTVYLSPEEKKYWKNDFEKITHKNAWRAKTKYNICSLNFQEVHVHVRSCLSKVKFHFKQKNIFLRLMMFLEVPLYKINHHFWCIVLKCGRKYNSLMLSNWKIHKPKFQHHSEIILISNRFIQIYTTQKLCKETFKVHLLYLGSYLLALIMKSFHVLKPSWE